MHLNYHAAELKAIMTITGDMCACLLILNIYNEFQSGASNVLSSTSHSVELNMSIEALYQSFNPSLLSPEKLEDWQRGVSCSDSASRVLSNGTELPALGHFYCPMPFEPASYTNCCHMGFDTYRCCPSLHNNTSNTSTVTKWGIGLGVVSGCFILAMAAICLFNKCTKWCTKTAPDDNPRPKLKIAAIKQTVKPVDKRTLLKTGNYTVEQSWEQITVKFYNREFYENFRDSLLRKYKHLKWKDVRMEQEGNVTNALGEEVGLHMNEDARQLCVTKEGNISWVMNDFQNVCKSVTVSDASERRYDNLSGVVNSLSPRLPTIGEEFFDAGDYHVKISQSEVEIKFSKETLFEQFKRMLLYRYPTLPWSKYLQRDCAQIRLESGKYVTIHLWEDIRSVWLSGDGKKDWYNKEFQELYADAVYGQIPGDTISLSKSRPHSATSSDRISRTSGHRLSRGCSMVEIPATYTVKTLEAGGFEIEFPTADFICEMKYVIEASRRGSKNGLVKWNEYSYRHVTKLKTENGKMVTIHLGNPSEQPRKMWIYDEPGCKEWFNGEFKRLYACAYDNIHKIESQSAHSLPSDTGSSIAPVEHTA